jgi:hypothetical protein
MFDVAIWRGLETDAMPRSAASFQLILKRVEKPEILIVA